MRELYIRLLMMIDDYVRLMPEHVHREFSGVTGSRSMYHSSKKRGPHLHIRQTVTFPVTQSTIIYHESRPNFTSSPILSHK